MRVYFQLMMVVAVTSVVQGLVSDSIAPCGMGSVYHWRGMLFKPEVAVLQAINSPLEFRKVPVCESVVEHLDAHCPAHAYMLVVQSARVMTIKPQLIFEPNGCARPVQDGHEEEVVVARTAKQRMASILLLSKIRGFAVSGGTYELVRATYPWVPLMTIPRRRCVYTRYAAPAYQYRLLSRSKTIG